MWQNDVIKSKNKYDVRCQLGGVGGHVDRWHKSRGEHHPTQSAPDHRSSDQSPMIRIPIYEC
jgi:hypothetical protein